MSAVRIPFILLCLVLIPLRSSAANLDSLLAFYADRLTSHPYFAASFTQSRHLAMFDTPLVSTGTIYFAAPDRIRFHYKTPFESVILLSQGTMKRYRIENGEYVEQPSLEIVAKAITREITRYLSGEFATEDFPYDATIDPQNNRHMVLIPSRSAAKAVFERIEITFPADPVYIKEIKLVEPNGDFILVEHEKPSFDELPDSLFSALP
ncbi:MAG: hypothetical protein GF418_10485 [Chitinivibrionales bacterium]|nr:hypothetical protein [Chitinivibrionales bacterium]MBD3396040.1 hypothetical protein [Chitinivibrionales bacterium]